MVYSKVTKKLTRNKRPTATTPGRTLTQGNGDAFDPDWYLTQYPDVASSGMLPVQHFTNYGRAEGRLPRALQAVDLDPLLWSGSREAFDRLVTLMTSYSESPVDKLEASYAGWFLARWYASMDEWHWALKAIEYCVGEPALRPGIHTPDLLYVDALVANRKTKLAKDHIAQALGASNHPDWIFATANLRGATVSSKLEIASLLYEREGLATIHVRPRAKKSSFDRLESLTDDVSPTGLTACRNKERLPMISVLMPVFNSEQTIETALRSILSQTWTNLEVLVVNDASSDASADLIKAWAKKDNRVKAFNLPSNQGAYAARNFALARSRGDFITVHDSDDWSHPQKLELQARALMANKSLKASVSHWIRATEDLTFGGWQYPPNWVSWCHRNTSSLMFRRSVFKALGFWDRVVCNADTEYYHRIMKAYGENSIVEVKQSIPLAFGRITSGSLTQSRTTSIFTNISGLRWNYYQAYLAWHGNARTIKDLYMPENPRSRPFPVEAGMLRSY